MPVILIGISISVFFVLTSPMYNDIALLRGSVTSYNEALDNSKALENERDKLTAKYNTISQDNLLKLQKFIPDNIDNIRLILEIEQMASPYGMVLKDVKYNPVAATDYKSTSPAIQGAGRASQASNKYYGIWNLEFSTSGTYDNFINFTKDLENNLRIVDISSIAFSSGTDTKVGSSAIYKYDFKIKTYWLKN